MRTATSAVNVEQRQKIEAAVAAAEGGTSCEIVPVVATGSGRYDRAEDIAGLWVSILGASVVWLVMPRQVASGAWNDIPQWGEIVILALTILICFVAGVAACSRIAVLRRLFTPRQQMDEEVNLRARELFFDRRVHHTEGASGILIYVSLFEHTAVVLGDRNVISAVGDGFLTELCDRLTSDLKQIGIADSICGVIQHASGTLADALPRSSDDVNELPDTLVLID